MELIEQIAALVMARSGCNQERATARAHTIVDPNSPLDYSPWRHGGWYVGAVRYPSGACGCVSRNYTDKKWRIVCGRPDDETFPNRDAAARAEQAIALAEYTPERIAAELAEAQKASRKRAERAVLRPVVAAPKFHLFYIEASDADGVHAYMVARDGDEVAAKASATHEVLEVLGVGEHPDITAAIEHCKRICGCDAELFEVVGLLADA